MDESDATVVPAMTTRRFLAVAWVTLAVGLAAGVGGLLLTRLLRIVQRLAYAYPAGLVSFLDGVDAASPLRRLIVATLCGVVVGVGWWALGRYTRPRVAINQALHSNDPRMPILPTILHATLQIVASALGSPLGREVAPREVGAAFGVWFAERAGLTLKDARLMLACGAGAGLAAVYNVPVAGMLFTLEAVLRSYALRPTLAALVTSVIATGVVRADVGDVMQYAVPSYPLDASLIVWSLIAGPLIGIAASLFRRLGESSRAAARKPDARQILLCVLNFGVLGVLAGVLPELLGNGKGAAQLAFDGSLDTGASAIVLVLKVIILMTTLRVGTYGGLLTPSIACGALLATILGAGWSLLWPGPAPGAYALVGGASFLGVSARMPLTAFALIFEMAAPGPQLALPVAIAVGTAFLAARIGARGAARRGKSAVEARR